MRQGVCQFELNQARAPLSSEEASARCTAPLSANRCISCQKMSMVTREVCIVSVVLIAQQRGDSCCLLLLLLLAAVKGLLPRSLLNVSTGSLCYQYTFPVQVTTVYGGLGCWMACIPVCIP